jgi:lysophospholipase L1-like esterase
MKNTPLATLLALALSTGLYAQTATPKAKAPGAEKAPAKPAAPAVTLPPQAPDVPAIKLGPDGKPRTGFLPAHERFVKITQEGKAQVVFLGDSITAGWGGQKEIWGKAFGGYQPANFGIGGDRTQHVLWRITNGELVAPLKPKAVVLMIGTNNVAIDSAEGIAKGITRIVETIRSQQPQAKILLLAVFPRGEKASNNPHRDKLKEVNATIAKLDDGQHIHYLDIGEKFLQADGSLSKEIMPDYLHLSPAGYQIWADAISPKLAELMK